MTKKDYAKRHSSTGGGHNSGSSWVLWLIMVTLFFLFTLGLVYLGKYRHHMYHHRHHLHRLTHKSTAIKKQVKHQNEVIKIGKDNNKYAFYTLLSKKKLMMPKHYKLEIANTKDYKEVSYLKAEVALLGLEANIHKVHKKHAIFYKLTLGPYNNEKAALNVQKRLQQHKIHSVLRKI